MAALLEPHCRELAWPQVTALDYDRTPLSNTDRMAIGTVQPGKDRKELALRKYLEALQRRDRYIQAWEDF